MKQNTKNRKGRLTAADKKFEGRVKSIIAAAMRDPELRKMFDEAPQPRQVKQRGGRST